MKNNKVILITGGRGFIAKNLINFFKKNYKIYSTSSYDYQNINNVHFLNIYKKKDINLLKTLKIDYLINCHGKIKNENYDHIYDDHYKFCKILFSNINIKTLKKIIHMGSIDEYGNHISGKDKLIKEKPESKYGQVKLMVTKLIIEFAKKNKINYTIFRIFLVYGLGQKKPRLIPYLINCLKNKKIANISDITAKKTFIHIDELKKIIEIVLFKKMKYNIYNLSTSKYISVKKILIFFEKNYGLKYQFKKNLYPKSQYFDDCRLLDEISLNKWNFFQELNKIIKYEI